MKQRFLHLAAALILAPASMAFAQAPDAKVDFARHVQPLFARHCYACHGAEKQKAGLRLDVKSAAMLGGDSGAAIVPSKAEQSKLIHMVRGDDPDEIMPPKGDRLSAAEIAFLKKWIDEGAVWPDAAGAETGRRTSDHWSFQPVKRPALPKVKDTAWPRNEIDSFILAKLEEKGLTPSPEADRYTLIRRLSLDLLGLPPTPQEADEFVSDQSANAYERLVDRILASPHYGERWGRHWLDLARYADSHGYSVDGQRVMWPYRDWVIAALNADMPFDEFTILQLAGDLLGEGTEGKRDEGTKGKGGNIDGSNPPSLRPSVPSSLSPIIATAFHRNTMINQEGGVKADQFRVEATIDRVNTTGQVWLGLTIGCAQCHTHKYDPITQKEYYQFYAFFNGCEDENSAGPTASFPTPEQERRLASLRGDLAATEKDFKAIKDEPANKQARDAAKKKLDAAKKSLNEAQKEVPSVMVYRELKAPRPSFVFIRGDFLRPGPAVTPDVPEVLPAMAKKAEGPSGGATKGESNSSNPKSEIQNPKSPSSRLDLARWLVSPENPLTPRVVMNRTWARYFPRGIVETEEDFGTQGARPTHPELLDWLAWTFVHGEKGEEKGEEKGLGPGAKGQGIEPLAPGSAGGSAGAQTPPLNPKSEIPNPKSSAASALGPGPSALSPWSLKAMHKLIVMSATYRQSSHTRADLAAIDPNNKLLGRQSRLRVEAEIVRDAALTASGLLSRKIGGPSVHPPQPAGVYDFTQNKQAWNESKGDDRYRRGMYTFFFRSAPYPLLTTFDVPNMTQTCIARLRSNTPLQALTVANDATMFELAQGLAMRVLAEEGPSPGARGQGPETEKGVATGRLQVARPAAPNEIARPDQARIAHLFRLCLTRPPAEKEAARLLDYLKLQRERFTADAASAKLVAPVKRPAGVTDAEAAAWTAVARALMNLDEFITRE